MLCGNVWTVSSETLASESAAPGASADADGDVVLPGASKEAARDGTGPWLSLARSSQRYLAGAGLAFLSEEEVDFGRLEVSTTRRHRHQEVDLGLAEPETVFASPGGDVSAS